MSAKTNDHPRAIVGLFIQNKANELLLVKSHKWPGFWIVPGGHVELGETIASAARREAKEETGLKVRFSRVFAVNEAVFPRTFARKRHFIFIECLCDVGAAARVRLDGDELQCFEWMSLKKALKQRLEPNTRRAVAQLETLLKKEKIAKK